MKVLITGAGGMLARAFLNKKERGWDVWPATKEELDITNREAVKREVTRFYPELMINCAAFTRVDDCEANRNLAFAVNGTGAGNLAEVAREISARLVHFSTDYIFPGTKKMPYIEEDGASPINAYGASKWEGECQVRRNLENHLIIRTQWLYGDGGNHFVKTILNLAKKQDQLMVVDDQVGSPTWTEDLSEAALVLISRGCSGTYHLVNRGYCSWYTFACAIIRDAGLSNRVNPCATSEFPRPARRPAYSVLSTAKAARELGSEPPHWEMALRRFIRSCN